MKVAARNARSSCRDTKEFAGAQLDNNIAPGHDVVVVGGDNDRRARPRKQFKHACGLVAPQSRCGLIEHVDRRACHECTNDRDTYSLPARQLLEPRRAITLDTERREVAVWVPFARSSQCDDVDGVATCETWFARHIGEVSAKLVFGDVRYRDAADGDGARRCRVE